MSYEITFLIKDKTQRGDVVLTTSAAPPAQAFKNCLRSLNRLGYPMRNTVTELIRELLYMKFELDFKGGKDGETIRSPDTRGSPASVGAGKAADGFKAI